MPHPWMQQGTLAPSFPYTMANNLPSSANTGLPLFCQSLVFNLQLVDESTTRHRVMPPSYGSSCQIEHRGDDSNLREHQELGNDPSSLYLGECDGDVDSGATDDLMEDLPLNNNNLQVSTSMST
ncbi:hypothetical protein Salat_1102900 [Sesamum alatum]|uniref:Uncharacterized protein n=1 Tax=Sesamum alatum TaxID=300844 RepID=A0AAE1YNB6_9LAMI|nr:hypothetical protein Salat_1102900 [Sesamum alatum]